jgi:hypothetical protein
MPVIARSEIARATLAYNRASSSAFFAANSASVTNPLSRNDASVSIAAPISAALVTIPTGGGAAGGGGTGMGAGIGAGIGADATGAGDATGATGG